CVQKKRYPASLILDRCRRNFDRKRAAFTGVERLTLITPSQWLADLVKQSFLKEYPVEVRYNTIDTTVFKPTPSDFRKEYGLEDKKIVLGVASVWDDRKGLDDFIALAKLLDDSYAIVLVGLSEKQIRDLPKKIIGIRRTNSTRELAAIYTAADVFVNPSREETFGLTTVEALSCGTKAIVYKDTACEEIVKQYSGVAVDQGHLCLYKAIRDI
ncbi:MAG: glycosyltransferase, partial [Oscillospiraceae bacterium]|nr:glycosyltransferase [Oscillospiraceae bacterium]